MNLIEAFRKECVLPAAIAPTKDDALRLVASTAKQCALLAQVDEQVIYEALRKRETLGSTGFGGGIAIPHCRLDCVKNFVVGVVTFSDGVLFDALDDEPVKLMVFIVAPDTKSDDHIRILSSISQVLNTPGAVAEMEREPSAEALQESFLRHVADEVDDKTAHEYCLFHVFIQNEDRFQDVLQVFGSLERGTAVVLDAEHSSKYLSKMPLFAGLWTDAPSSFSQLIVALVSRKMVNETIRRIERVTGKLSECKDIIVTVQELFFCAGSLAE